MKYKPEIQVSNILRWALPLKDRVLVQFQKDRGEKWQEKGYRERFEWERGLCLNPIMENAGDCGISGEELHQRYRADIAGAELHMARVRARYADGTTKPFFSAMRVVTVLDDALLTKLHGAEHSAPTVGDWLAQNGYTPEAFPLVSFEECNAVCGPKPRAAGKKKYRDDQVGALAGDTPVDVAYGRDGTSDDCFITDAGTLTSEGFCHLRYDGDEESATVWVSRSKFYDLMEVAG